jgi:hypothetical protein
MNDKLTHTILYMLRNIGRPLSSREVMTLVYLADREHYRRHLSTITGVQYVAGVDGPEFAPPVAQAADAAGQPGA